MNKSIRLSFGKKLIDIATEHDFLIFNADTKSCGLEKFGDKFPQRNFTFGIAEQNLIAAASGAALCGEKVFLSTFAVFASMRACEQVRTFICYPNLNVTILASHGGLSTGYDGATHIALEDVGIMRTIPNMTIVEPSDWIAGEKLVYEAVSFNTPLYIRFPKEETPQIHSISEYNIRIGKANHIIYGDDVTVVASGWILSRAIEAAKFMRNKGIYVDVLEMHTVKPLDTESLLKSVERTGAVVTIEDHSVIGGLGSAVAEVLAETYPVPMKQIGVRDMFGESGAPEMLYRKHKMTTEDIINAILEVKIRKEK